MFSPKKLLRKVKSSYLSWSSKDSSSRSNHDDSSAAAASSMKLATDELSSPARFDRAKEKTFEFIVRVLNQALTNASDSLNAGDCLNAGDSLGAVDCLDASDSAMYQSDSDSCDAPEELDDLVIKYLNYRECNQLNRSGSSVPIQAAQTSPDDSKDDSTLIKIVRVLNAAKLRSLNNGYQAKKPPVIAGPLQVAPATLQIEKPVQQVPKKQLLSSKYEQDFPGLSNSLQPALQPALQLQSPSWPWKPQANVTDLACDLSCDFCQKLKLNETDEPESGEPALLSAEKLDELYRQANIKIQKGVCQYCQLNNPNCVLKCSNCPIYFCNGRGQASLSHILNHLKESGHNEVDFKLDRAVGNPDSCNLCNSRNVFSLGFISDSQTNRYLLCSPPCKQPVVEKVGLKETIVGKPIFGSFDEYFIKLRAKLKPYNLFINGESKLRADGKCSVHPAHYTWSAKCPYEVANIAKWKPLISERCLVSFVVGMPSRLEELVCRMASAEEIESVERKLAAVRAVEEKYRFGIDAKDLIDEEQFKKIVDMPVLLSYKDGEEYQKVFSNLARIEKGFKRLSKEDELGTDYVFNKTCKALKRFATNKMAINPEIYEIILGHRTIESSTADDPQVNVNHYKAPNLPPLNNSQALAIKHSLENPVTLIQGPPGTGKTTTSAAIVYHLSKLDWRKKEQILVCAPSNIACDHLALKIRQTGLKVVRLLSKTKEKDYTYRPPLAAHFLLNHPPPNSDLAIFMAQLRRQKWISEYAARRLERLQMLYLNAILNDADVICVTCVTSSDFRLGSRKFKYLLIDEVAQCTEPEVIIPLNRGVQKLILIGDIQQLSPVIKNRQAIEKGYDQSLMLRLNMLGNRSHMLNRQYRMHPQLSRFSREMFYDSLLKDGVTEQDRVLPNCTLKWPTNKPMFFYSCREEEQVSMTGRSYLNRKEGMVIAKIVLQLVLSGITASQIGIITPYAGHREHLRTNLKFFSRDIDYEKIEIESINAFQGREKDIIILSTVRSNSMRGRASTGFLGDSRRLNVALTRARFGMIIIGDHLTLMQEPVWYELLLFYRNNNLIFRGKTDNLQHFPCHLQKPKTSGVKNAKVKSNYFKAEVEENGTGEKTVQFQKVVFD